MMVLAESLPAPDARLISGSGEHILLTDAEFKDIIARDGKIRPYVCPSLRNRSAYLSFVKQLIGGGIVVAGTCAKET